jgi:L-fuconolactonase
MASRSTRVADSQVHLFPAAASRAATEFGHRVISAGNLISAMDEAGVDRAVLIPPRVPEATNADALAITGRWPDRLGMVAKLSGLTGDLPEAFGPDRAGRVLGARVSFPPSGPGPAEPQFAELWSAAERAGLPVMVWSPRRLDDLAAVARSHPGLRVAIDHCGLMGGDGPPVLSQRLAELVALAGLPNVSVKASALPLYSEQPWPFADIAGFAGQVIEAFGASRVFWGSDLSGLRCSYRECRSMLTGGLPGLSADDRALVMGEALLTWLGWTTGRTPTGAGDE